MSRAEACFACGRPMTVTREDYDGERLGCRGIILQGVDVRRCPCGECDIVVSAANLERIRELLAKRQT